MPTETPKPLNRHHPLKHCKTCALGALEAVIRLQLAQTNQARKCALDDLRQCAGALLYHCKKLNHHHPTGG